MIAVLAVAEAALLDERQQQVRRRPLLTVLDWEGVLGMPAAERPLGAARELCGVHRISPLGFAGCGLLSFFYYGLFVVSATQNSNLRPPMTFSFGIRSSKRINYLSCA